MKTADTGAARSRLAARESFFGGPLSTREQAKAPGWQAIINKPPVETDGEGPKAKAAGARAGASRAGASRQQPPPPPPDPEKERRQKLKQRRDFSGLDDDAPPAPLIPRAGGGAGAGAAGRQQQTAAGPPPRQQQQQQQQPAHRSSQQQQQQQQQRSKVTTKRAVAGGGGKKGVAARNMAVDVTSVGKGRKQLASDALKLRVGEMVARRGSTPPAFGSPNGSGTAGDSGGKAAAAAAAARAARDAANAKAVLHNKQYATATGMQTLQLVRRPQGQGQGGAAAGTGGGGALAAMRAGAAGGGSAGAGRAGASPGSVSKGPRPATGAGASRARQQHARPGGGGAGRGGPQFRGAFYGGQQPPAALEARMQYNKRRLSLDSGGDLDSFIASDDDAEAWEADGAAGEDEDWRAALREVTGGYDPSKFRELDKQGDRDMEAGYGQIQLEERRAARIARAEDEREAEAEALREANKRERKRSRRSGVAAFLDDGD